MPDKPKPGPPVAPDLCGWDGQYNPTAVGAYADALVAAGVAKTKRKAIDIAWAEAAAQKRAFQRL